MRKTDTNSNNESDNGELSESIESEILLFVSSAVLKFYQECLHFSYLREENSNVYFVDEKLYVQLTNEFPQFLKVLLRAGVFESKELQPLLLAIEKLKENVCANAIEDNRRINQASFDKKEFIQKIYNQRITNLLSFEVLLDFQPALVSFFELVKNYNERIDNILQEFEQACEKFEIDKASEWGINKEENNGHITEKPKSILPLKYFKSIFAQILALKKELFANLKTQLSDLKILCESLQQESQSSENSLDNSLLIKCLRSIVAEVEDLILNEEVEMKHAGVDLRNDVNSMYMLSSDEFEQLKKVFEMVFKIVPPKFKNKETELAPLPNLMNYLGISFIQVVGQNKIKLSDFLESRINDDEKLSYISNVFSGVLQSLNETYGVFHDISLKFVAISGNSGSANVAGRVEINGSLIEILLNKKFCLEKPYSAIISLMHEFVHAVQIKLALLSERFPEAFSDGTKRVLKNLVLRSDLLPLNKKWIQFCAENLSQLQVIFPKTKEFFMKRMYMTDNHAENSDHEVVLLRANSYPLLEVFMEIFQKNIYYSSPLEIFAYMYQEEFAMNFFDFLAREKVVEDSVINKMCQSYAKTESNDVVIMNERLSFVNEFLAAQTEDLKNMNFGQIESVLVNLLQNPKYQTDKTALDIVYRLLQLYHAAHLEEFHGFSILNHILNSSMFIKETGGGESSVIAEQRVVAEIGGKTSGLCFVDLKKSYNFESVLLIENNWPTYTMEDILYDLNNTNTYSIMWLITRACCLSSLNKLTDNAYIFVKTANKTELTSFYTLAIELIPMEDWLRFFDEQLTFFEQNKESEEVLFELRNDESICKAIKTMFETKYFKKSKNGGFEGIKGIHTFEEAKKKLEGCLQYVQFIGNHAKLLHYAYDNELIQWVISYINDEKASMTIEQRQTLEALMYKIAKQEEKNMELFEQWKENNKAEDDL